MSIQCQCTFCGKGYKLKDELLGKKVNCKNPSCGKSFIVVATEAAGPTINQAELDALAAAAFSDEPVQETPKELEQIQVTCAGCDFQWFVGIDKEGKNVPCPECRKVNRVPKRQVEKKVDWRGGNNSGRPTYAKVDEAPKVEGAIDARDVQTISDKGAREYLKTQEEPDEPSVVRKRWAKRIIFGLVVVGSLGGGISYLVTARREIKMENSIAKAIEEVSHKEHGFNDKQKHFHSLVHRAAAEHRSRDAKDDKEYTTAEESIKSARNNAKGSTADHQAILSETAQTVPLLLEAGNRIDDTKAKAKEVFLKELRQTLQLIADPDLLHDTLRGVTRKLVDVQQTGALTDLAGLASQLGGGDAVAQVGLELVRLGKKTEAEEIFEKNKTTASPQMTTLRLALNKPAAKGQETAPIPRIAEAEAAALLGDAKKAIEKANAPQTTRPDERSRALIAVAHALEESAPAQAIDAASKAAKHIVEEGKGQVAPWVIVRACRVLGKVGKPDEAEKLADALPDAQTKAWGKLEAVRGQLLQAKAAKKAGSDTWLDTVGDASKLLAAAKAREELARHNAKLDGSYQKTVEGWPKGTVRPFGYAGLILGQQDHQVEK